MTLRDLRDKVRGAYELGANDDATILFIETDDLTNEAKPARNIVIWGISKRKEAQP